MTKAYLTPPKVTPPKVTMKFGQMQLAQRFPERHAPPGFGRTDGKQKKAVTDKPALATGMKRQTTGKLHPYLHGHKLCDEPLQANKDWEGRAVPIHPGMTPQQVAKIHPVANNANAVLQEAGRLGAPVDGWKPPEKT